MTLAARAVASSCSDRPDFRRRSEQFPQRLEPSIAKWAELASVQRRDGSLQRVEQATSFARDSSGHNSAIRIVPRSARQSALFEPVEEPRYVRVTRRRSFSDCGQRCAGRARVLEDAQHVVLLRRDTGRPEQRCELVDQLARQML